MNADPLARGVEQGWIRPAMAARPLRPWPRQRSAARVLEVLDEDRDEGRARNEDCGAVGS